MNADFTLFPDQASTTAERVDGLLALLLLVTVSFATVIAMLVFYFAVRYRRRSVTEWTPRIMGSLKLELAWTLFPAGIALVIFLWGAKVYFYIVKPPAGAEEVYMVGKQWMWKVQHRGGQREINELHIPVGKPVKLTLTSEDVIHSFFVPAFRTKVDVLPNRYVHTWFEATKPGIYPLFCSQYCGTGHADMTGWVVVMEPADFQRWLGEASEGSLALEGRKLLLKYQCVSCHSADAHARGPVLERLYGTPVTLTDGRTVMADESYLRQSILDPDAQVVAGFQSIMPTYEGQIDEEELIALIEFLKTMQTGATPERVDTARPPTARRETATNSNGDAPASLSPPGENKPQSEDDPE